MGGGENRYRAEQEQKAFQRFHGRGLAFLLLVDLYLEDLSGIDAAFGIQIVGSDDVVDRGSRVHPGYGINRFPAPHFMLVSAGSYCFGFCLLLAFLRGW